MNESIAVEAQARQWADTRDELERAKDEARRKTDDVSRLNERLTTLSECLGNRVGPNVPLKVFDLGDGRVIIVEHKRAIQLVTVQKAKA